MLRKWRCFNAYSRTVRITPASSTGRLYSSAGETLTSIASKFGTTLEGLAKANNLPTGAVLAAGEQLNIPKAIQGPAQRGISTVQDKFESVNPAAGELNPMMKSYQPGQSPMDALIDTAGRNTHNASPMDPLINTAGRNTHNASPMDALINTAGRNTHGSVSNAEDKFTSGFTILAASRLQDLLSMKDRM